MTVEPTARREEILAIATRIFADKGYAGTTVREIADAAGILSGSLYHHFPSKESMLHEIMHGFLDGTIEQYRATLARGGAPSTCCAPSCTTRSSRSVPIPPRSPS